MFEKVLKASTETKFSAAGRLPCKSQRYQNWNWHVSLRNNSSKPESRADCWILTQVSVGDGEWGSYEGLTLSSKYPCLPCPPPTWPGPLRGQGGLTWGQWAGSPLSSSVAFCSTNSPGHNSEPQSPLICTWRYCRDCPEGYLRQHAWMSLTPGWHVSTKQWHSSEWMDNRPVFQRSWGKGENAIITMDYVHSPRYILHKFTNCFCICKVVVEFVMKELNANNIYFAKYISV